MIGYVLRMHKRSIVTGALLVLVVSTFGACASARTSGSDNAVLTVVSYNIRHGRGNDEQVDLERTARVLREQGADIIALQEVDNRVQRSGSVAQADSLGRLLGMHPAFGAFMDYQGGQYGMGLLSRRPLFGVVPVQLPDGNEPRVALLARTTSARGDTIAVFVVHFDWVSNDTFRFKQATALTRVLDTLSTPYIVVGDFNDVPPSRTLALFRSRAMEAAKPAGASFTFPSPEPRREIDYIFAAPMNAWTARAVRVVDERVASDHRPVRAELELRRVR